MKKTTLCLILFVCLIFITSSSIVHSQELNKNKLKKEKEISIKDNKIAEKIGKGRINFKNSFDIDIEDVSDNAGNIAVSNAFVLVPHDQK